MDKLRALEYFVAAAEERSFSAAARRLQVSAVAVSKGVAALEATLAVCLFERHARGLTLTGNGATYLELCKPGLAQLLHADEMLSASKRVQARPARHRGGRRAAHRGQRLSRARAAGFHAALPRDHA